MLTPLILEYCHNAVISADDIPRACTSCSSASAVPYWTDGAGSSAVEGHNAPYACLHSAALFCQVTGGLRAT